MTTCAHCGYEAPSFTACPLCGARAADTESPAGAAAGAAGADRPPAWEDGSTPFPKSFVRTWVESLFRPDDFFRGVPWEAAAARPILYYLIIAIVGAVFTLWWSAAFAAMGIPLGFDDPGFPMTLSPVASALINFFAAPFFAMIGLVIWSVLLHVLVALFARDRRGLRATVRTVCYGAGPSIFAVVPLAGPLVGFFWGLVLTVIGVRHAHRTTTGAAVGIVAIAVAIPFVLLFAFFVLVFASLATLA